MEARKAIFTSVVHGQAAALLAAEGGRGPGHEASPPVAEPCPHCGRSCVANQRHRVRASGWPNDWCRRQVGAA